MESVRMNMDRITSISQEKLYYRNDKGELDEIDLLQCRRRYIKLINAHLDEFPTRKGIPIADDDDDFRCVADRCISGEPPYFEFYDWPHIRFEIQLHEWWLTKLLDLLGWNWKAKRLQLFMSIQEQLTQAGWTTFDLS